VHDIAINLVASVIAGVAVWLAQRLLAYRRLARKRAFFGLDGGARALLVVARHASSPREQSVHRRDVSALVELAAIARECGARAELVRAGEPTGIGNLTEFCVGGPDTNPRAVAHLRTLLPGVRMSSYQDDGRHLRLGAGVHTFEREPGRAEYAVLARSPVRGHAVFSLLGQASHANLAAARYLGEKHRSLHRQYGADRAFCLILRVVEPDAYGADLVEVAADVTADAFGPTGQTEGAVPRPARPLSGRLRRRSR
jgi:hypothetical protein